MSRLIDIHNYEEFALDFIEGTLSPEQADAFQAFLLLNPAIEAELKDMANFEMPSFDANLSDEFKNTLKVDITPIAGIDANNFEETFALAADADLNPELAANAALFAEANPTFKPELALYKNTKLKPVASVVLTDKAALKQAIPLWAAYSRPAFSIAAAIILLLGITSVLRFTSNSEVYNPRQGAIELASITIDPLSTLPKAGTTSAAETTIENQATDRVYLASTETQIKKLKALKAHQVATPFSLSRIEERQMMAFELSPIEPFIEDKTEEVLYASAETPQSRTPVLNVTQFIGQKLFGLEPQKSETTRELFRESVATMVDRNEIVDLKKDFTDPERKKFELIAGKFEFTKVTYK
ncbi:MAG: hypothetical protein NWQ55_07465 [Salibacteraceae bacterium]|jgi:hypothetical protein|nr:hypothetical protein [Salibacteraceae bacterium]MDP4686990.1 hypothetical protein [Salibacteraceae bacterium]MDP4763560.1 hypothetical protein [Salibacteraceae bacterium]MDP4844849.1 hypothetical protein [Salibacteraceae bacterium]MDP4933353.1 hypothetical protein [Salibacteraceae bacterium]